MAVDAWAIFGRLLGALFESASRRRQAVRGRKRRMGAALFLGMFFYGCVGKPVLKLNGKLKAVGEQRASEDIAECEDEADKHINEAKDRQRDEDKEGFVLKDRKERVVGAVSGILKGDTVAALPPHPPALDRSSKEIKRRVTVRCLSERGYEVVGFD